MSKSPLANPHPEVVLAPNSAEEIAAALRTCRAHAATPEELAEFHEMIGIGQ